MEKMFEKASRLKLRFETPKGLVNVEDLWEMPFTSRTTGFSLDDLAKSLNRSLKESSEESFVVQKSSKNELLELKFEIVKYVIKVRLEEKEAKENLLVKQQKKAKIQELIARKKDAALEDMDITELEKMMEDM